MAGAESPKTPAARTSLPINLFNNTPTISAFGSPLPSQKRTWQGGNVPSPSPSQPFYRPGSVAVPAAQMAPVKRQRVNMSEQEQPQRPQPQEQRHTYYTMPAASPRTPTFGGNGAHSPLRPPPQQSGAISVAQRVFLIAVQKHKLLQPDSRTPPVLDSRKIDSFTHTMWQIVFKDENLMRETAIKASMFPQIKLRALARLQYMACWWVLREMACELMKRQKWIVDDSEMQTLWKSTLEECQRNMARFNVQGDHILATQQDRGAPRGLPGHPQ